VANCVAYERGGRLYIKFASEGESMRLYGLETNSQLPGDLLVRMPLCDQLQDAALTVC
jgi:hypothetical protein